MKNEPILHYQGREPEKILFSGWARAMESFLSLEDNNVTVTSRRASSFEFVNESL